MVGCLQRSEESYKLCVIPGGGEITRYCHIERKDQDTAR